MPTGIYDRTTAKPRAIRPVQERFWEKVNKTATCWLWQGTITPDGYGDFRILRPSNPRNGAHVVAHRFAYESVVGPIPEGLTLDHLCRVRHCVNPAHLEPVTGKINILRGTSPSALRAHATHCPKGHPYDLLNTHVDARNHRTCRQCSRDHTQRHRIKRRSYE